MRKGAKLFALLVNVNEHESFNSNILCSEKMNLVGTYKDSLRFNQYDLHVIVSGLFNMKEYFSAKVINVFPVQKCQDRKLTLVEITLLYKITRQDGIFVKRHLQNYSNVHTVLVSHNVGEKIGDLLRNIDRNNSILISFTKRSMHQKCVRLNTNEQRTYFFMLPGLDIVTTTSGIPIHYTCPTHFYSPEHEDIPSQFIKLLDVKNFVYISELDWYVNDLRVVPIKDSNSNMDQNAKSIGITGKSVLSKKLTHTKEQPTKGKAPPVKQCVCYVKICKATNTNNAIENESIRVKKPEHITEITQPLNQEEVLDESSVKLVKVKENKEIVPFRIIDEIADTRNDVSHLHWGHR